MHKKLIVSLLTTSVLLLSHTVSASEVKWGDPLPNTPAVKAVEATATTPAVAAKPATGGIGYEWWIVMGNNDKAEFVGSVGAKSSYEPTFKAPDFGWQHTSNWVALDLTADALVSITVARQQGVKDASLDSKTNTLVIKNSGEKLYPVVSMYKNWEESGVETGSFNPVGKASWQNELVFIGIAYADKGQTSVTFQYELPKGKYTLNIGGANGYAPNGCAETDASCFTGNHGYRAQIVTGSGANVPVTGKDSITPTATPTPTPASGANEHSNH